MNERAQKKTTRTSQHDGGMKKGYFFYIYAEIKG